MLQDREQLGAHEQTRSKCRHSVCAIECAVRVPVSAIPGMHYMGTCSLTMHTHLRTCTPAYAARTTQYRWASDASVGRGVAHAAEYTSHARAGSTLDAQNGPVQVVCASRVSSRNEHADKHTQCLAPLRATAAAALPFFWRRTHVLLHVLQAFHASVLYTPVRQACLMWIPSSSTFVQRLNPRACVCCRWMGRCDLRLQAGHG